jgi:hypothetical protein
MKKIGSMLLCAVIMLFVPLSLSAMEYQHKIEGKGIEFAWTIEGDQIHVMLTAKTTGWLAVGFDPEDAMEGANIVIGAAKGDKVKIEDHYGDRKRGHSSDTDLGGKNDVLNPAGFEKDDTTVITFTYPLNTGEKVDKPIHAEGKNKIMLAYGAGKDSFKTRHPYRAVFEVDLSTGESKEIK